VPHYHKENDMLSIGKQLTAEQRVSKAVYDIISNPKYVALAGVVMVGDRTVSDTVPTACTNGRDELYGRAFVEEINDPELRFLVLHEVYHKLYKHLTTWEWMYKQDANACQHRM
jgi:predicted metal-dependent peptidase